MAEQLYALDDVTRNHECYRNLLFDMTEFHQPTLVSHTDSQVIIKQLDRGRTQSCYKYLRLAFEAVKDRVAGGHIELPHVS